MQELDSSLAIGSQIGDYRIIDILGAGGFGITYKAEDTLMHRLVALKEFLPQELAGRSNDASTVIPKTNCSEDYQYGLDKFLDEARTLAKFNHPNIVKAYTLLQANGTAYLVMEYVEGEALDEHLKKIHFNGNMAESRIREIIEPVLNGLAEVHKAGLLHRDIKPGNIYLQNSSDASDEHGNNPMLIDFGAARQSVGEKSKSISAIISQGYAPPEQYTSRGKQGTYTDIYAIGAVMYYLATGTKPIESTDRQHEIMDGEPDPLPSITSDNYSEAFKQAVIKAMVLVARNRCQNVAAMQKLLSGEAITPVSLNTSADIDNDATRKISKEVVDEKHHANNHSSSAAKSSNQAKTKNKQGNGKLIAVIATLAIAAGGYYGFMQYQAFQAEAQTKVEKQKQQAIAKQSDDKAWKQAENLNNQQSYQLYINNWPKGQHITEAEKQLADIQADLKRKQRQAELAKLDKEEREKALRVDQVKQAQSYLTILGYKVPSHGNLDKRTEKAIEAFEKQQDMMVTGAVDDILINALSAEITKRKTARDKAIAETRAAEKLAADIAAKKKQEQDRLAAIEVSKVETTIITNPDEAKIELVDLQTNEIVIYRAGIRLLPKLYQVTLSKAGYVPYIDQIDLTNTVNSKRNFEFDLERDKSAMALPAFTKGDWWKYETSGAYANTATGTIIGEKTYQGKHVYIYENKATNSHSQLFIEKSNLEMLAMTYGFDIGEPTEMDMKNKISKGVKWPMKIGNKWESINSNMTTYNEVVSSEIVKVPAGEFRCFKVVSRTDGGSFTMDLTAWYSPEVKYMVKQEMNTTYTDKSMGLEDSETNSVLLDYKVSPEVVK